MPPRGWFARGSRRNVHLTVASVNGTSPLPPLLAPAGEGVQQRPAIPGSGDSGTTMAAT